MRIKGSRIAEFGSSKEEKAISSHEGSDGWLLGLEGGEGGKAKPAIGDGIEGKGLIVLGGDVVETVEEEPGLVMVRARVGDGGKSRGGDNGVPELADSRGANESGDRKKGEDELDEV